MSFLGNNIKVHFAGSDGSEIFHTALQAAGIHYRLYSVFPYIDKKKVEDDFTLPQDHVIKVQDKDMKHVIQDSGLFTLMFGARKNRIVDRNYLLNYQDCLIKFVTQNKLKCTCVEIDCQKVLGVEDAWFFRERMKKLLPNRQINVFHYEDERYGLDKLIEFSDYIAISVPELRIIKPKQYKTDAVKLAEYCKKRKPKIDIHMLGCTEYEMLKNLSFCTTSDSTSWLQGVQYGYINDGVRKSHIKNFRDDLIQEREKIILNILQERAQKFKQKTLRSATSASLCATICKNKYERQAGDQS